MAFADLRGRVAEPSELLGRLAALQDTWVVGGWLRDGWLGRSNMDIDLAVAGELEPVLRQLTALYETSPFELGLRHGSHRLVINGATIDISPVYGPDIDADLLRRDYTVNSMALPAASLGSAIQSADLLMHPEAEADLEGQVLRSISRANLEADPLRILRGYRLCAELGFSPEPMTRQAWCELVSRLPDSAAERQHEELLRLLNQPGGVAPYVQWMAEDGALWELMPELEAMAGCEQNAYHHLDVWTHTLEALDALEGLRGAYPDQLAPYAEELDGALAEMVSGMASGLALLRLSLLLHDVDKPRTRETQPDGRITFYKHQELGAETARELLTRLKFSAQETELVCLLVLEHLRLGYYCDSQPLPPKLIYRYIRRLGDATPLAVLHSLADCLATRGPLNEGGYDEHLAAGAAILEHFVARDAIAAPPMLLDGNQIMDLLEIGPGRLVGELKELLAEATAEGEIDTEGEARDFVRDQFQRLKTDG